MRKVITYGTFDLFHKGHYNILKRAKEEGDYLIVGITGETYDSERGKLSVQDSLAKRIENVKNTGFADQIIVEEYLGQKISDILKYNIDVLVIGSDWRGKFDHLRRYCEVKYLERTKDISSTQLRQQFENFNFGIVTDTVYDNENVTEPKHVSGIHVESVFSENKEVSDGFCKKYELFRGYTDYKEFLDSVDIVYIKSDFEKRYKYSKEALLNKKHVICDVPVTLSVEESRELNKIADDNGVLFISNLATQYLQAFGQLIWMVRGNLIGDIISVKAIISKSEYISSDPVDFKTLVYYPIYCMLRILGSNFESTHSFVRRNEDNDITYSLITMKYPQAIGTIEVNMDYQEESGMQIVGTEGTVFVPNDWWKIGYFKIKYNGDAACKRYCSNFEGNGFRYLIQSLMNMIRNNKGNAHRETPEEIDILINTINKILQS